MTSGWPGIHTIMLGSVRTSDIQILYSDELGWGGGVVIAEGWGGGGLVIAEDANTKADEAMKSDETENEELLYTWMQRRCGTPSLRSPSGHKTLTVLPSSLY